MAKKNDRKTFIVQILSQQNATWQGLITWTEGRQTQSYRSALELIKLIDSAEEEEEEERESGQSDDKSEDQAR
jgi:hypothetical protein